MEIRIQRDDFAKSLSLVSSIVPIHPSLFVLSNMLIEADKKGVLYLSATDLDISMRIKQDALVENEGNAILPARKIFDVVKELPQELISMKREGEKLVMDCGRGHFELQTFPGEEYPALPRVDFQGALRLKGETLLKSIEQTTFALSKDLARPILTGVLLEIKEDHIGVVATDGHRLARFRKRGNFKDFVMERDMIIPMKALNQIKRLFSETAEVEIAIIDKQIGIRGDGREIYTRLMEGPFPNYELVIPKDNEKEATINVKEMIGVARRMQVLSNPTTKRVTFEYKQGQLNVKVRTRDVGKANEALDIEYDGEELEVSLNAGYFEEALKVLKSDRFIMLMKETDTACIIKPETMEEDEDYFNIIMPLRIMEGEE